MSLSHKDYVHILTFYNIDSDNMSKRDVKALAEDMLATKLCRCIKKVDPKKKNEKKSIKICRDSVLHKKGVDSYKFKCKKKSQIYFEKRNIQKII